MKKKLLALLLVAVTLMSVLSLGVSAAGEKTLKSYLTLKSVQMSHSEITIVVTGDTVVDENTVIPGNVKVIVPTGTKLSVSASLVVFGELTVAGNDLKIIGDGAVSYPKCNYCFGYWNSCWHCGYNWHGTACPPVVQKPSYSNNWCSKHNCTMLWCNRCVTYYCYGCAGGYHNYDSNKNNCFVVKDHCDSLCGNHKHGMTFCRQCNKFYCVSCTGGVHVYNAAAKVCVVRPVGVSGPVANACSKHKVQYTYCADCKTLYCVTCAGGVHVYDAAAKKCSIKSVTSNDSAYCGTHSLLKSYCDVCKKVYCITCEGGVHITDYKTGKCYIGASAIVGSGHCGFHGSNNLYCSICKISYCPICKGGYYHANIGGMCHQTHGVYFPGYTKPDCGSFANYVYVPGYGYIYGNVAVSAPYTGIASGKVAMGTSVTLKTATTGASIYYTTDGSAPKANNSYLYHGEKIEIDKDVTVIRAIAVLPNGLTSCEAAYTYTLIAPSGFDSYKAYADFNTLVEEFTEDKVLPAKFSKTSVVSYDVLTNAMTALGLDVSKAKLTADDFDDKEKLTYEEVIYASYKIMRSNKIIDQAEKSSSTLVKKLDNYKQITDLSRYKIAYAAMIEAEVLAELDFKPQAAASANLFVHILDWAQASL